MTMYRELSKGDAKRYARDTARAEASLEELQKVASSKERAFVLLAAHFFIAKDYLCSTRNFWHLNRRASANTGYVPSMPGCARAAFGPAHRPLQPQRSHAQKGCRLRHWQRLERCSVRLP